MLDRLRAEVAALGDDAEAAAGLLAGLEADRADAYRDVVETLRGDRYLALLDRLEAAAEPPLSGEEKTLTKIFHREAKRMRRTFAELGDNPEDDALHASRIAVKRARYAADLAAHELGKPGARFVAVAKQLQDILGDHQDAVVAQERIREWAESAPGPESAFAAGTARAARARPDGGCPGRLARHVEAARRGRAARRSAETRSSRRRRGRPGRQQTGPRCSSSIARRTTTGRFPKGKLERGETEEECALREVEEETGLRCTLGRELESTTYRDAKGRPQARAVLADGGRVGGELGFDHETDDARWLTFDEAAGLLSYERDIDVLRGRRPRR